MRRGSGQEATEFVLVVILVFFAALFVVLIFGKNISNYFTSGSSVATTAKTKANQLSPTDAIRYNQDPDQDISSQNTYRDSIGSNAGGSFKPAQTFTIQIDNFTISNIAEDLAGPVQSTGTSGGEEQILAVMEKISQQLAAAGDIQGAKDYKDLANLGHFVAQIQKKAEADALSCGQYEFLECIKPRLSEVNSISVPSEISHLIPGFNSDIPLEKLINDQATIDKARLLKITDPSVFNNTVTSSPNAAMIALFDKILNNPGYSDSLKGTTIALMDSMNNLSVNMNAHVQDIILGTENNTQVIHDVVTGNPIGNAVVNVTDVHQVARPQTSTGTNLKSKIICGLGYNKDTGYKCY